MLELETMRGEPLLVRADDVAAVKAGSETGDYKEACSTLYLVGGQAFEVRIAFAVLTDQLKRAVG